MHGGNCSAKLADPWPQALRLGAALHHLGTLSAYFSDNPATWYRIEKRRTWGETKHFVNSSLQYGEKPIMKSLDKCSGAGAVFILFIPGSC